MTGSRQPTLHPHLDPKLACDPVSDLAPVTMAGETTMALAVAPAVPASVGSTRDLMAWLRGQPRLANVGSPGFGTLPHLLAPYVNREMSTVIPCASGLTACDVATAPCHSTTRGPAMKLECVRTSAPTHIHALGGGRGRGISKVTAIALGCASGSVFAAPTLDVYAMSAGGQSAFGSQGGPFTCATFAPDPRADRFNPGFRVSLPTDGPGCGVASETHSLIGNSAPVETSAAVSAAFGQPTDPRVFNGSAAARAAYGDLGVRSAGSYSGTSDSSLVTGSGAGALQTEAFTFAGASGSGTFRPTFTLDGALFTQGRTDNQIVFSYSIGNGPMSTTFRLQDSRGDFTIYAPGGYVASYPGLSVSGDNTTGRLASGSASFQISVPMSFGTEVDLNFALWAGTLPASSVGQAVPSNGSASFYSSVRMTGIEVLDSGGNIVPSFSVTSGSGTLYGAAGVVPEPGTWVLLVCGLGVLALRPAAGRQRVSESWVSG
jgi:hypothetical protein